MLRRDAQGPPGRPEHVEDEAGAVLPLAVVELARAGERGRMGHQPLPVGTCVVIYLALLALTAVTVGAAYLDLSFFNTPIALTIASAKALLVMLFFMDLRHSPRLTWVFIGTGILWLVLLVSGTIADVVSRGWLGVPGK